MYKSIVSIFVSVLLLTGCQNNHSPSEIALEYFIALHNNDIDTVMSISNEKLKRVLEDAVNTGRINQLMNSEVQDFKLVVLEEKIKEGKKVVNGERVGTRASVKIRATGTIQGKSYKADRKVYLVHVDNEWKVKNAG